MKNQFTKVLKAIVILIFLIIVAGAFFIRNIADRAIPDYNLSINLERLNEEVTVTRDQFAVPTIYAENEEDLYRAAGYIMAQDRLWQMDLLRRATTGRLSEIFGEDLLNTDLLMRSLQMTEKSKMVLGTTDEKILIALEAFSDGVNQYIEHNNSKLPPEFFILGYKPENWQPEHSINLIGYMAWDLNMGWTTDIILHRLRQSLEPSLFSELIPDLDLQDRYVHPHYEQSGLDLISSVIEQSVKLEKLGLAVFSGSNNWAVSGEKSVTGKPILANDMHLGLFAPGIWYQMHHVIDGELNVSGVVLPGQPLVIAGHNEDIAWGMTNVMVNDVDFYLETINPDNPYQYKFMGEWVDMKVIDEIITINSDQQVEREILFTHRGPIISDHKEVDDQAISMRWTGFEYSNELRSVYLLNRASNWNEFRDAVKTFISVSQNIIYADNQGNIGIQTSAGIPIREGEGILVASGEDDTYDWKGIVPFSELPYTYNPPEGYVASANNRTVSDDYPYYISHWYDMPYRYNRIAEMLEEKELLSIDDFKNMLGDKKSKMAEEMMTVLLRETEGLSSDSDIMQTAVRLMKEWDWEYSADKPQPLIFESFYITFLENLLKEQMGQDLYNEFISDKILVRNIMNRVWSREESAWLKPESHQPETSPFANAVRNAFTETIESLVSDYGDNPENWAWGDAHTFTISHPVGSVKLLDMVFNFNRGEFSPGGSFHTVCPYSYNLQNAFIVNHGASQRHLYSTGNWDDSFTVIPTGTSGIPASQYYCDQTSLYVNDLFRDDLFTTEKVELNRKYSMQLQPAER